MNLDAQVTIRAVVAYFDTIGGDVTYAAVDKWIRRGLLTTTGQDDRGRLLVRFGDVLDVEARTHRETRGRPRTISVIV